MKKNKYIWFFTNSEPNQLDNTNVKLRRHGQLMKYLSQKNYKILCFTSNFSHFEKKYRTKFSQLYKINKNLYFFAMSSIKYEKNISFKRYLNQFMLNFKFKSFIKSLKKPDLIILSIPPIDSAVSFANYAKKYNVPLISDFRDMWPDIIPLTLNPLMRILFLPFFFLMNYNLTRIRSSSSYLISVSKGMLKWIKDKDKKQIKSDYIYLSHFIDRPLSYNKLNKDKIKIFYSGVVSTANNMQYFLKMIDLLPSVLKNKIEINIAGYGDQYNLCESKNYKFTNFLGWVNQDEIKKLASISNFGLVTYKPRIDFLNNIPNKISEYLGYGLPVLTTIKGESFEILEQKKCGMYIDLDNFDEFKRNIERLFSFDDKNYLELRNKCRETFEEKFDSHNNLKKYEDIIKETINEIPKQKIQKN